MSFLSQTENPTGNSTNPGNTENNFDSTSDLYPNQGFDEFFIYLLPVYYFLIIGIRRITSLPLNTTTPVAISNSFQIKNTLCLVHCILFILNLILAEVLTPQLYWIAGYRKASLLYFFAVVAWYIAYKLLSKEVERGLPQQFWTFKIFWISSFAITIWKFALPYETTFVPLILNIFKAITELILFAYAVAKPYDSDEAKGQTSDSLPFVRQLLEGFEEMECTKSLFRAQDLTKFDPLLGDRKRSYDGTDDFMRLRGDTSKPFTQIDAESWLKSLPVLTCRVTQKIEEGTTEEKVKVTYFVRTKIGNEEYEETHNYRDFLSLEDVVKKRCNQQKCPWIDREPPTLEKTELKNYNDHKQFIQSRNAALESFLNTVVTDPRFVVEEVIEFLGIEEPHKSLFNRYNEYLRNMKKTNAGVYVVRPKSKPNIELTAMNNSNKSKTTPTPTPNIPKQNLPNFVCECSGTQKARYGDHFEYIFIITETKTKESWTIVKSFKDFKDFNENLEKSIDKSLTIFDTLIPKPDNQRQTTDPAFVEKRKVGLDKYMKQIIKDTSNYNEVLYSFIKYEDERRSVSSRNATPRGSFSGK